MTSTEQRSGGGRPSGDPSVVLHRCRMPSDYLCPCGAVARRLERLDIAYETVREPWGRKRRSGIVEATGQRRVPVLVRGDLALSDSRRILEYLDRLQAGEPSRAGG